MKLGWLKLEHWLTGLAIVLVLVWVLDRSGGEVKTAAIGTSSAAIVAWIKRGQPCDTAGAAVDAITGIEAIVQTIITAASVPAGLIPYIDPVRASDRTGQIVHQFVAANGQGVPVDSLAKFVADVTAKALKVTNPATVTTLETTAGALLAAGVAVFAAVQAVQADRKAALPKVA